MGEACEGLSDEVIGSSSMGLSFSSSLSPPAFRGRGICLSLAPSSPLALEMSARVRSVMSIEDNDRDKRGKQDGEDASEGAVARHTVKWTGRCRVGEEKILSLLLYVRIDSHWGV